MVRTLSGYLLNFKHAADDAEDDAKEGAKGNVQANPKPAIDDGPECDVEAAEEEIATKYPDDEAGDESKNNQR